MKIDQLFRITLLLLILLGVAACESSESSEAGSGDESSSAGGADGSDSVGLDGAPVAPGSPAEQRLIREALGVTVFFFDFDVAEFRTSDRATLTYHARDLAANPDKRIRLEGHADERGTREYNLALGERRAEGIENYMIVNGASRSQIEVVSYGEERPTNRGTNEGAYQQNRRVEVVTQ
ncbi:MAG: peptidoglycan-associated lipoprotein Pal [Pseudohongiellaceae bacterium]